MSQQYHHCKRHHHRHNPSNSRGCQRSEKQNEAEQINSQCKLINKIASIDIWATERLCNKWRHQEMAEVHSPIKAVDQAATDGPNLTKKSCLRHGGISIGSGSEYFDARKPKASKVLDDRGNSDGDTSRSRDGCKITEPNELQNLMKLEKLKEENRRRKIQPQPRKNRMQQESHESTSSLNETREGSSSRSQTPKPKTCPQKKSSFNNELPKMRGDSQENLPRQKFKTLAKNLRSDIRNVHQLHFNNQPDDCRPNQPKDKETTPKTIETFVTIESLESADIITTYRVSDRNLACHRQKRWQSDENESKSKSYSSQSDHVERQGNQMRAHPGRQSSNSSTQADLEHRRRSLSSDRLVNTQFRRRSIDQSTYNIIKSNLSSPTETQPKKTKPYKDHSTGALSYNCNIAEIYKTGHCQFEQASKLRKPIAYIMAERSTAKVLPSSDKDGGTLFVKNRILTNTKWDKRKINSLPQKANQNVPTWASQRMPARAMTGNNSVDGKSLLMLPPTTDECATNTEYNELFCPAVVSEVKPFNTVKVAKTYVPEVKLHSNATEARDSLDDLSEDLQSLMIQTEHETSDLHNAGLAGSDSDEENETERFLVYNNLDAVEDGDNGKNVIISVDTSESTSVGMSVGTSEQTNQLVVRQKKNTRRSKVRSDNKNRYDKPMHEQRWKSEGNRGSKNLLPMTACPTTQHRVECYRTQSGRVKCYLTARHPVRCQIHDDGQIVCKATLQPQASDLPYPCNAAWQCY